MTVSRRPPSSPSFRAGLPSLLLLVAALLTPGCGPGLEAQPQAPLLLLGIDGLEWNVLRPLMEAGRCPNLKALAELGSYGKLGTIIPTYSPVVWTSISTGKALEVHGITGFVDPQGRAYTSSRRSGRALWNIADRYGLSSGVYGWWITWPVEPIRGVMVSGTSAVAQLEDNWKPALMPGLEQQVHPPALERRVMDLAAEAGSREALQAIARGRIFGDFGEGVMAAEETKLIDQTLWSVQSDATYFQIARSLMPEFPADLTLVYFGGPDVAGHRFWRQLHPEEFSYGGSSPKQDEVLAGVLPNYYEWVDEMVGELIAAAGEGTNVLVVSDHGMHAVATTKPNKRHISGDHQDGAPGVLIAAGPDIRQQGGLDRALQSGALITHGSIYSIAPTVLGLLGIPGARDMEARVYPNILTPTARERIAALKLVATHDDGFRDPELVAMSAQGEAEFKKRMAELGYLDLPTPETSRPVNPEGFVPDPDATSGIEDG